MPRTIRILADRSKDAGAGRLFTNLLPCVRERPGEQFRCTDNRLPLKRSLLNDYDVLVIGGQSLKQYTKAELKLIRQFVEDGGGLLLAASAAVFELEANEPVEKMAQNAVAGLFGAQFLSADCEGARAHGSLEIYVPSRQIKAHKHPALGEHSKGLLPMKSRARIPCSSQNLLHDDASGPIVPPPGARTLASYRHTGQPVAAAARFGNGRVVMVGAAGFSNQRPLVCPALAHWLAAGSRSKSASAQVPAYIGGRGTIQRGDYFHITCEANCADAMQQATDLLQQADAACKELFGKTWKPARLHCITDTLPRAQHHWEPWWPAGVGAQVPAPSQARQTIQALLDSGLGRHEIYEECLAAPFSAGNCVIELAMRLLGDIGHQEEADRCRQRADRWIAEMDGRAATFDLARNYTSTEERCPRGLVLAREFLTAHGYDAIGKMAEALPEKAPFKHLPPSYAWHSDRGIYYLSLGIGKDLFPWFAERGLTVHPLPIVKPTATIVKSRMMARLNEAMRDEAESLSSRMEAALDLVAIGQEKDWLLPGAKRADDWSRLCHALKLSKQGDKRAATELKKLFASGKPDPIRAIAGLALADSGDSTVAVTLIRLARKFEPRFQLAAGHALDKAGSDRAGELSLHNITDAHGKRVGKLEVISDGYLAMHCCVEGYKVANVSSLPEIQRFTSEAAVSSHSVHWVHTSAQWRRCGLSRCLMEKTMHHPAAAKCSVSSLGTGTRNVAHRLYHDFGFTDVSDSRQWICELAGSTRPQLPTGVLFREYQEGDGPEVNAFLLEVHGDSMSIGEFLFAELPPQAIAYLAEKDGKIVGATSADYDGGDEAYVEVLAVAKDDQRAAIADSLLALLHRALREAGAKRVSGYREADDENTNAALQRAGYVSKPTGGIWMLQVRHLPQFLQEMASAIEKRLAASDFKAWEGRIDLIGSRLQGRLTIRKGKVTAGRPTGQPADIVMTCDDETATRVALGIETPFAAYLQERLDITPRINDRIVKLLETVYPKVPTR